MRLRNLIVHDYFKERISLTSSYQGRDIIIDELKEFIDRVRLLDSQLVLYSTELQEKLGISQKMLYDEVEKFMKESSMK